MRNACLSASIGIALALVGCRQNQPPVVRSISGPIHVKFESTYAYVVTVEDKEQHQVFIRLDWGDGDTSGWAGPLLCESIPAQTHAWTNGGTFEVRAQARDVKDASSGWSLSLAVYVTGNQAPSAPAVDSGPTMCYLDSLCEFRVVSSDPEGDNIRYRAILDAGDTTQWSEWSLPDSVVTLFCRWTTPGSHGLWFQAQDERGTQSVSSIRTVQVFVSPGNLKWTFPADTLNVLTPAVGDDGTVYLGCKNGCLYALNPDGSLKWRYQTVADYLRGSPSLGPDGTIYFGSHDGYLHALRPDGSPKWSARIGSVWYVAPAIGADGTVYVGTSANTLYAINPDGSLKWSVLARNRFNSSPAIGADGTIYIGNISDTLYAFNPDGTRRWTFTAERYIRSAPAIADDGTVYFGADDGYLYALNPDGTLKWQCPTAGRIRGGPALGADGTVYFGSTDDHLYALSPDGTLLWSHDFGSGSDIENSPVVTADGTVVVATDNHFAYGVSPDGTIAWTYLVPMYGGASPTVTSDGTIYLCADDGTLHAVAGRSPLANTAWPKFQYDLRNTGRAGAK